MTPLYHSKLDLSHGTAPRLLLTTVDSDHLLPEVYVARESLDLLSLKAPSWANQCILGDAHTTYVCGELLWWAVQITDTLTHTERGTAVSQVRTQ